MNNKTTKTILTLMLTLILAASGIGGTFLTGYAITKPDVSFTLTDNASSKTVSMDITVSNAQVGDVFLLNFEFDNSSLSYEDTKPESSFKDLFEVKDNHNSIIVSFGYLFNNSLKNVKVATIIFSYSELNKKTEVVMTSQSCVACESGTFYFNKKSVSVGSSFITGDVDGNGTVNVSDARLALRAAVKLDILTENALLAADVDKKNGVTVSDARTILRVAVGLDSFSSNGNDSKESPETILKKFIIENGTKDDDNYVFTLNKNGQLFTGDNISIGERFYSESRIQYDISKDKITISTGILSYETSYFDAVIFDFDSDKKQSQLMYTKINPYNEMEQCCFAYILKSTYTKDTILDFYEDQYGAHYNSKLYSHIKEMTKNLVNISLITTDILLDKLELTLSDFGFSSYRLD